MTAEERERIRSDGAAWAKAHPLSDEQNRRLRALADPHSPGGLRPLDSPPGPGLAEVTRSSKHTQKEAAGLHR